MSTAHEQILVRPAETADAGAIAAVYAPYVTESTASFEVDPPDRAEMTRRLTEDPLHPWLVATGAAGTVLGYAYAAPHRARPAYRWSVETSVYVSEPGRGTGTALLLALIDVCRAAGFVSAYAGIALPNPASTTLHARVGFTSIGTFPRVGYKLGRWVDVGWWHRALASVPDDQAPPEPTPAVGVLPR